MTGSRCRRAQATLALELAATWPPPALQGPMHKFAHLEGFSRRSGRKRTSTAAPDLTFTELLYSIAPQKIGSSHC